jgi:hypothetical protein
MFPPEGLDRQYLVDNLSSCWVDVVDHAFEKLSCQKNWLPVNIASLSDILLDVNDILHPKEASKGPSRDNEAICLLKNLGEILESLQSLYFSHDLDVLAFVAKELPDKPDVLSVFNLINGYHMDLLTVQSEDNGGYVLITDDVQLDGIFTVILGIGQIVQHQPIIEIGIIYVLVHFYQTVILRLADGNVL